MPPTKPDVTYSTLIVIRVTHTSPKVVSNVASVVKEELSSILPLWMERVPEQFKPTVGVFTVSEDDFPMRMVPC